MGIDYLTPADRYYGLKKDTERLLNTSNKETGDIYLAGRIEGQPLRAKENNQGNIDVFLAGKKISAIKANDVKKLFSLI